MTDQPRTCTRCGHTPGLPCMVTRCPEVTRLADDQPTLTGREHWLEAERLLALAEVGATDPRDPLIVAAAHVHALLALAAPAYAFHQERRDVVADSPNITRTNEGPTNRPRMNSDPVVPVHVLKTWPPYYAAVADGTKTFEVRKNDRGYAVGDLLCLREWDPASYTYSGRETWVRVSYILPLATFAHPGSDHIAMAITRADAQP